MILIYYEVYKKLCENFDAWILIRHIVLKKALQLTPILVNVLFIRHIPFYCGSS